LHFSFTRVVGHRPNSRVITNKVQPLSAESKGKHNDGSQERKLVFSMIMWDDKGHHILALFCGAKGTDMNSKIIKWRGQEVCIVKYSWSKCGLFDHYLSSGHTEPSGCQENCCCSWDNLYLLPRVFIYQTWDCEVGAVWLPWEDYSWLGGHINMGWCAYEALLFLEELRKWLKISGLHARGMEHEVEKLEIL
jgi:hypothetical protein